MTDRATYELKHAAQICSYNGYHLEAQNTPKNWKGRVYRFPRYHSCEGGIEKSVPSEHRLSSLDKPPDANWWSCGRIFISRWILIFRATLASFGRLVLISDPLVVLKS